MTDFDSRAKNWDEAPGRIERANAVAAVMREHARLSSGMSALEYGCGTGLLSFALQADLGQITLADSSAGMLEVLKEKIAASGARNMTPLKLDLSLDPLPEARFDLIYTLMVLHHIPDTTKILTGFHALLKPGGLLCIADLDKEDGSFHAHEAGFDGHNGFCRGEFRQTLYGSGFVHVRMHTCYEMVKADRHYPLFLAIAEKK
jgi:ubiquinone/menaquinone biosynthesis C-methylase UbiE